MDFAPTFKVGLELYPLRLFTLTLPYLISPDTTPVHPHFTLTLPSPHHSSHPHRLPSGGAR